MVAIQVFFPFQVFADTYTDQDVLFYDKSATLTCSQSSLQNSATTAAALQNVPDPWRSLIASTAPKYPTADARLVAATLWVENRGWPEYKTNWATSSAAAQGPWQFIPSTWAAMGTDGDGDGVKDPNNPKDAVHAAFKHQLGSNGKPIIEGFTGNVEAGLTLVFKRDRQNLLSYLASYNGSGAPSNTPLNQFPRNENSDYVIMGYWLLASNFKQGYIFGNPSKPVDAATYGNNSGGTSTSTGTGAAGTCDNTSTGAIGTDGYAFPVGLPKNDIYDYYKWPCTTICHHDGTPAFDLARMAHDDSSRGVPVYAIRDGVIKRLRNEYKGVSGCNTFQLYASDGYAYWYGHMEAATVKENQKVTAGQQLAVIGRRACTGNQSYPHLHIDRGYPKGEAGGSSESRDPAFIPLMNSLYERLQ